MASIHLPIRQLVEFLLRTGSIDSRFAGFDRANEGARIHRKLQKAAGEGYQAEVFLSAEREACGIAFTLEGRADGIFTDENGTVTIDEIKTTTVPYEEIAEELNPCHWAQGMVYAAIFSSQQGLDALAVRLTYYQVDTDQIQRFTRQFTQQQLEQFLRQLLMQYAPWAQRQLDWDTRRSQSLAALQFPFAEYRPGQRALAGEVYRACRAGKSADRKGGTRVFCQAPTGIGKTMSALFPALKAMGEGCGAKLFYLTARNTTQAAAEDAVARLRAAQPGLALRSVTLTAKEKACLHPDAEGHPACLPEVCPFANGYYDRRKDALAALLDGSGSFSRAALADTARQFSVCSFELGLDLSEWCDVVIGDYNYLFDPVVHLKRFFDAAGDWLFLIDEAHNLPDRARAMYSAQFAKSSLTEAKRALGKGKSSLKTALTKADKVFLAARKACAQAAPRIGTEPAGETEPAQISLLPAEAAPDFALPQPLYARDGTVFLQQLPAALPAALRALQLLKKLCHQHGILASGNTDCNLIPFLYQLIIIDRLGKTAPYLFLEPLADTLLHLQIKRRFLFLLLLIFLIHRAHEPRQIATLQAVYGMPLLPEKCRCLQACLSLFAIKHCFFAILLRNPSVKDLLLRNVLCSR